MRRSLTRARASAVAATTIALTMLIGACGGSGSDEPAQQGSGPGQPVTTAAQDKSVVETAPPKTAASAGAVGGATSQPLALEQRHPNGTVLRLTRITPAPTSLKLTVEAVNGYTEMIELNLSGIQLRDDVGNSYNFVEPEQNEDLEILPGATLRGDLTFLGELDRRATSLKLLVNASRSKESIDLAGRSASTRYPEFQFDRIPLTR